MYSGVDAWRVIEIQSSQNSGYREFLLVFQTLSIYVDIQGRKSRDREIMYPAVPTHISEYFWIPLPLSTFNLLIIIDFIFFQLFVMAIYWYILRHIWMYLISKWVNGFNRLALRDRSLLASTVIYL